MAGTITHKWNGTILEITSDSGTSAMDLRGKKGDTGARGVRGLQGERGGGAAIEDGIISTETTWSSAGIMDNFAEHMSVSGNPVSCNPIPNYPLHIITNIEPQQSGSGEPTPSNIRPISGIDAVNVIRCGKNLLPFPYKENTNSKTENGITYAVNADSSIKVSGTSTGYSEYLLYDGKPIFDDIYITMGTGVSGIALYVVIFTDNGNTLFEHRSLSGFRININDYPTAGRLYICLVRSATGTAATGVAYPMICLASNNYTTYEPYNGNTFTISLGETIYGGSLDWNTGVLTVNKKAIVLNGGSNENWVNGYLANGKDNRFEITLSNMGLGYANTSKVTPMDDTICDTFGYQSTTQIPTTSKYRVSQNGTNLYLLFNPPTSLIPLENLAAWKTWLSANPVTVVLPLAEPYTIKLTPQEIKAIKGQNTLYTNADNLQVIGRVDTMYQLSMLAERVAALEAALINA